MCYAPTPLDDPMPFSAARPQSSLRVANDLVTPNVQIDDTKSR